MQPNQQDPNTQPGVPQSPAPAPAQPLPYQVPEYLDLGPVVDPIAAAQNKRKKNKMIALIVFAFVLLCFMAGGVYWLLLKSTPEERFYGSLERQMQNKYVAEAYSMSNKDNSSSSKVKVVSDFSDTSAIKTSAVYELKSKDTNFPRNRQIEEISTKQDIFFDRVITADDNLQEKLTSNKLEINRWYRTQTGDERKGLRLAARIPVSQNSLPLLIITGNFSPAERSQMLGIIRSKTVYQVQGSRKEKLDGADMSVYTVTVNVNELLNIFKSLSVNERAKNPAELASVIDDSTKYDFWFDSEGTIKKILFDTKSGSTSPYVKRSVLFDYPTTANIKEPTDVKI